MLTVPWDSKPGHASTGMRLKSKSWCNATQRSAEYSLKRLCDRNVKQSHVNLVEKGARRFSPPRVPAVNIIGW